MTGATCPLCGGDMNEVYGFDGCLCDTCFFVIRSDGSPDYSEMDVSERLEKLPFPPTSQSPPRGI